MSHARAGQLAIPDVFPSRCNRQRPDSGGRRRAVERRHDRRDVRSERWCAAFVERPLRSSGSRTSVFRTALDSAVHGIMK